MEGRVRYAAEMLAGNAQGNGRGLGIIFAQNEGDGVGESGVTFGGRCGRHRGRCSMGFRMCMQGVFGTGPVAIMLIDHSSSKSISQTMHTSTPSVLGPLLTYHLSCDNPEPTFMVIRRVLTALIHHIKDAEQFALLADVLVQQFTPISKTTMRDDPERLRRMLEVVSVTTSVRQGSCFTHMSSIPRCLTEF